MKQEQPNLTGHLSSPLDFYGVHKVQSLVVFYKAMFFLFVLFLLANVLYVPLFDLHLLIIKYLQNFSNLPSIVFFCHFPTRSSMDPVIAC